MRVSSSRLVRLGHSLILLLIILGNLLFYLINILEYAFLSDHGLKSLTRVCDLLPVMD